MITFEPVDNRIEMPHKAHQNCWWFGPDEIVQDNYLVLYGNAKNVPLNVKTDGEITWSPDDREITIEVSPES